MSANALRRANQQVASYWPAVAAALESEDETHVDPTRFRVVPCPKCGALLLDTCSHARSQGLLHLLALDIAEHRPMTLDEATKAIGDIR